MSQILKENKIQSRQINFHEIYILFQNIILYPKSVTQNNLIFGLNI
jgi:ABC-type sugar transport system ATPase subunit